MTVSPSVLPTFQLRPVVYVNQTGAKVTGPLEEVAMEKNLELFCEIVGIDKSVYQQFLRTL